MRAIVVNRQGGPEVLELAEVPDPEPGEGEIAVDVAASGVNFIDVYFRSGAYPMETPFTPGSEGAGTVSAVGQGVDELSVGDRVAWAMLPRSYAERVVIPAARAVPVPDEVTSEDAAAVMLQGMTAHYLTHATYRVQPGDTVLVHAAAGGVGLLLTQIVKLCGGRVIGTVSTPDKEKLARDAGADHVIRYADTDDLAQEVRDLTGGVGVAAVYEGVGKDTFEASLASLRPRGMLALFGQSSGAVPPFDLQRLNAAGSLFVTRPTLAHYVGDREQLLHRAHAVLGWVGSGQLSVHIGGRYPLADAGAAHTDLQARRTTGKLLLLP
ncbi:MAG: zinc-binding dehydrogenase [Propionibacteriales bacterium]|nr:zinc-binding dehydrogenase [Propionibacteriales bacterium]